MPDKAEGKRQLKKSNLIGGALEYNRLGRLMFSYDFLYSDTPFYANKSIE